MDDNQSAATDLANACIRYLAAQRLKEKCVRKQNASALTAICEGGPQKEDKEEIRRIQQEVKDAEEGFFASAKSYVAICPDSVPKYPGVTIAKEDEASAYAIDFGRSIGVKLLWRQFKRTHTRPPSRNPQRQRAYSVIATTAGTLSCIISRSRVV